VASFQTATYTAVPTLSEMRKAAEAGGFHRYKLGTDILRRTASKGTIWRYLFSTAIVIFTYGTAIERARQLSRRYDFNELSAEAVDKYINYHYALQQYPFLVLCTNWSDIALGWKRNIIQNVATEHAFADFFIQMKQRTTLIDRFSFLSDR
jgi:hypothetical protein